MADIDDKLTRGIGERNRLREGRPNPISSLAGAVRTVDQLVALQVAMSEKRKTHREGCKAVEVQMQTWRENKRRLLASLAPEQRDDIIAKEAPAQRKRLLNEGDFAAQRIRIAGEIHAANASAQPLSHIFTDAVAYLDVSTLGSQKRRDYAADLLGANPSAVSGAIERALAEGNADMLAAAVAATRKFDKTAMSLLRWKPREAASELLKEPMRAAKASLLMLDHFSAETEYAELQVTESPIPSDTKIQLGLKQRAIDAFCPEFMGEVEPTPEPDPKEE